MILGYNVSILNGVTINGSTATIGIRGIDEGDASITFLWKYGEPNLTVNRDATVKPVSGDIVVAVYVGFFAVEIIAENESLKDEIAALSGTSGKIEYLEVDTAIENAEDGEAYANSLLDRYAVREETVTGFYVSDDTTESALSSKWTLSYPALDIENDFVVVERRILYHDPGQEKVYFKLKNVNFYSRYGTVLFKNDKQVNNFVVRDDDKILKSSSIVEVFHPTEDWSLENAGVIFYPTEEDGGLYGPANLDGFYPV